MRWQSIVAMGLHNELIRDTIVVGLRDRGLSERIHLDLILENAIRIARQSEEVKRQQSYLRGDTNSEAFTAATLCPVVERKEISSVLKMPEHSRHTVSSSRGPRIVGRHEHLRGHGDGEPTAKFRSRFVRARKQDLLAGCGLHVKPKLAINQFYPYIRCGLCCGFLIDATTITECLHTFCKSCIVKHFFYSNRCPSCTIIVHQTQPLYNIRPDRQLQDIVYKMIPFLEEVEKEQMCNFYKKRGLAIPKSVVVSTATPLVLKRQKKDSTPQCVLNIPPELDVSLLLDFVGAEEGINSYKPLERPYVRVSGEATIRHVELFIRKKMELSPTCQVDVVCGDHLLDQYQSLKDVQNFVGAEALQDGLLVLHFGLVLSCLS